MNTHPILCALLLLVGSVNAQQGGPPDKAGHVAKPGESVTSRGVTLVNKSPADSHKKASLTDVGPNDVRVTSDPSSTTEVTGGQPGTLVEIPTGATSSYTGSGGNVTIGTSCAVTITALPNGAPVNWTLSSGAHGTVQPGGSATFNT